MVKTTIPVDLARRIADLRQRIQEKQESRKPLCLKSGDTPIKEKDDVWDKITELFGG